MKRGRREALILGAAGLAACAAGFLAGPLILRSTTSAGGGGDGTPSGSLVLPSANLVDLTGHARTLSEWRGRVLVCNFWATWCDPCREEIPLLMAAREKYRSNGVEIVGIAIDNRVKVVDFAISFKISYPVLLAEAEGLDMMRKLGNTSGGLPYTVITDRQGGIAGRKLGAFHPGDLDAILDPLTRT